MTAPELTPMVINPDDFLETDTGRVWTPERSAQAWLQSYDALERALTDASTLLSGHRVRRAGRRQDKLDRGPAGGQP